MPYWRQHVYIKGMNEHLKQEAQMVAGSHGGPMSGGTIQEDRVPVSGDITDMVKSISD